MAVFLVPASADGEITTWSERQTLNAGSGGSGEIGHGTVNTCGGTVNAAAGVHAPDIGGARSDPQAEGEEYTVLQITALQAPWQSSTPLAPRTRFVKGAQG